MPIDFRCPQCDKLLRTPDDSAGKQAKCPQCAAILRVPAVGTVGEQPAPLMAQSAPDSQSEQLSASPYGAPSAATGAGAAPNPFQAPQTRTFHSAPAGESIVGDDLTGIGFVDIYRRTIQLFFSKLHLCAGSIVIAILLMIVLAIVALVVMVIGGTILMVLVELVGNAAIARILGVVFLLGFAALMCAVYGFIVAGLINFYLPIARGQSTSFGNITNGGRWAFRTGFTIFIIAVVVMGVASAMTWFGITMESPVALVVTLIVIYGLLLLLWAAPYLVVDRNYGAIRAVTTSLSVTMPRIATVFAVFVVFFFGSSFLSYVVQLIAMQVMIAFREPLWALYIAAGFHLCLVMPFALLLNSVLYCSVAGRVEDY